MMITTWRILWIPTPGFGVSTDVVVFCVGAVAEVVVPLVVEPALAAWLEPPPAATRDEEDSGHQPAPEHPALAPTVQDLSLMPSLERRSDNR